jgi:hypothetical protein
MIQIVSDLIEKYAKMNMEPSEIRKKLEIDAFEFKFSIPTQKEIRDKIHKKKSEPLESRLIGLVSIAEVGMQEAFIAEAKDSLRFDELEKQSLARLRENQAEPDDESKRILAISDKKKDGRKKTSSIVKDYADILFKLHQIGISSSGALPDEDRNIEISFEILERKHEDK